MRRKILFWVHDPEAPSFRHRLAAHIPDLEAAGFSCVVERFPRRRYGLRVVERISKLKQFDILVVAKFKLEISERTLVRRAAAKIVYDFDDAIYYSKPADAFGEPDRSARRVRKFKKMCALADLVLAGNETLASFARPSGRRVEIVPTGIDLVPYRARARRGDAASTLVWIGLPGNLPYLKLVEEPIARLSREFPRVTLKVVSEKPPENFRAPVEFVRWSKETEAGELESSDIGIMPLADDDWTRGKGGFKLLQYMAAGLATVASPVGVNCEIIVDGKTGFLAGDAQRWEDCLRLLLESGSLRDTFGRAGRARVEERYEKSIISRRLIELFERL